MFIKLMNMTHFFFNRVSGVMSFGPYFALRSRPRMVHHRCYHRGVELNQINLMNPTYLRFENDLFRLLSDGNDEFPLSRLTTVIKQSGLMPDDQRLEKFFQAIQLMKYDESANVDEVPVNVDKFSELVRCNTSLMYKIFTNNLMIPKFNKLTIVINDLYWKCLKNTAGTETSYSRSLDSEAVDKWSVSLCTIDGQRHNIGNSQVPVVLHACSDPINFALAVQEHGEEIVKQYVANEPLSRGLYGSESITLNQSGIPDNPLSIAGTLIMTSLLCADMSFDDKLLNIMDRYRHFTGGGKVSSNDMFYNHQKEVCDGLWANAYHLSNNLCFPTGTDLGQTMDLYMKLQSLQSSSEELSVLAATLANGGVCPTTGERILSLESTNVAISLMFTSGISNKFTLDVGIPAMSGISGGFMALVPGVMGLFMWSPKLNSQGISNRGIQFCEELSKSLDLHYFGDKISGHHNDKVFKINSAQPKQSKDEETDVMTKIRASPVDMGVRTVRAMFAASYNDITALRTLYLAGHDMNEADYNGRTPLHVAASDGKLEAVKFLVEKCGVQIDAKDKWGSTPLDDSTEFKRKVVEEYLMNRPIK